MKIVSLSLFIFYSLISNIFAQSKVFTHAVFTTDIEGPAVNASGDLYLVNVVKNGTIAKVAANGSVENWLTLPNGSVGNGIKFKNNNEMYVADFVNHNILLIDIANKKVRVFAHSDDMNQPNDIAISSKGNLYASDPNWKEKTGQIWLAKKYGSLLKLEANMGTVNGIAVSPKDKYLYVNESVQRNIWRYTLDKEGLPKDKTLIHQFDDFGMDGMRCDIKGNLYVCRYDAGVVVVLNKNGKLLRTYNLIGKKPSNIAFGGKNGKTAFITLQDEKQVECFEVPYPGLEWSNLKQRNNF